MERKRRVEVFTAGCGLCDETVALVRRLACASCEVVEVDTTSEEGLGRARELGVEALPAVAIDGVLASCCAGRGPREEALRAAGLGEPLCCG